MSVVDQVKDRLDIVEVIQPYVPLKKAGRNYKGLCPFHAEKTPSFVVFPDTGTWHCFGACGTGGDAFSFIMQQENMDFGEALKMLAQRVGVELEPRSPEAAQADKRLDLLREINRSTANYFHHLLLNADEAARARAYLDERGLNKETIDGFQIGYALNRWDGLLRYLENKSYSQEDMLEAGLVIERDDRTGRYDRFRGRLMFPIRDHRGRTIGFGGRVLDDGVPKYLNSPQTPLFDKSSVLFGLDHAKKGIRTVGQAVIVEGYMDVLMAHQYGINNVVAQMGTALTEAQLRSLKRHTQHFILALDSDTAGDQATLRGLDVARRVMDREAVPVPTPRGLIRFEDQLAADIRIVSLPIGLDPDEVIRESPSEWAKLTAQAKPVMDYYFEALTADLDLTSAKGKADAVRSLGPLIMEIGDRVQRTHYLQQLARMVQVDERSLLQQIRRESGSKPGPRRPRVAQSEEAQEKTTLSLDEHCLGVALTHPDMLGLADTMLLVSEKESFRPDDLGRPDDRAILTAWRRWLSNGGTRDARAEFYDTLDDSLQARVSTLIETQASQPPAPDDLFRVQVLDAFTRLRLRTLRRRSRELDFMQADMQSSGEREMLREYMQLNNELRVRIKRLEQATRERSISGRRREEDASVRVLVSEE